MTVFPDSYRLIAGPVAKGSMAMTDVAKSRSTFALVGSPFGKT